MMSSIYIRLHFEDINDKNQLSNLAFIRPKYPYSISHKYTVDNFGSISSLLSLED